MESVKLRIKGSIVTNRFGALSDGDIIKTDEAYAKHLVDMGAAEYEGAPKQATPAPTQESAGEPVQAPAQETVKTPAQETVQAPAQETVKAAAQEAPETDAAAEGARQLGQDDKSTRRRKAD